MVNFWGRIGSIFMNLHEERLVTYRVKPYKMGISFILKKKLSLCFFFSKNALKDFIHKIEFLKGLFW